ncbi:MAG: PepSY domain-containing protein [Planctomycetota bacterium]|nr:PepSY domain-containing protein [Planctomycetota bacterium]
MKRTLTPLGLLLGLACFACSHMDAADVNDESPAPALAEDDDDDDDDQEELISVDEIPQAVKDAALAAVPGLVIEAAEKELEGGALVYCVHGTAKGESWEVEVTPDGNVVEIEQDDDEEEDDDDR